MDDNSSLLKWSVSGPVVAKMLQTGEDELLTNQAMPHHENTPTFEATFKKDKSDFIETFLELGNSFQENENRLIHIISKHVLDENAANSVIEASKIGKAQFEIFVVERIQYNTKSIYDTIKKKKIVSLQAERCLYASLYVACQSRDGDLDNFFIHENHLYPPSISEYGKLRKCLTKSDFLVFLNGLTEPIYDPPNIEMKVIDGACCVC